MYNTGYIPSFILISLLTIQFPYTCVVLWREYTESTGEQAKTDRRDQGAPEVCPFRCELHTAKGLGSPPCQSIFLTKLHVGPSTAVRWTAWILCWRVSCLGVPTVTDGPQRIAGVRLCQWTYVWMPQTTTYFLCCTCGQAYSKSSLRAGCHW